MKLRELAVLGVLLVPVAHAEAGGLFLPGSGAISTSRAGAAVASASDGEALSLNPAGLAKAKGTTITLSMALINYAMEFTRTGTYDAIAEEALPYEGMPYPTVKNDPDLALGIGKYQPVPVVAIVTDLGGAVPNLTLAAGLYAPNAYPFRKMCTVTATGCEHFAFNSGGDEAPLPVRYDVVEQDAAIILPTIAAAYRITPELDVGARLSAGFAHLKSKIALWGTLENYNEYIKNDGLISADATDTFVPTFGFGVAYRPAPAIEIGLNYSYQISVTAKGDAISELGPNATLNGNPIVILPSDPVEARCAQGGTREAQKVCAEFALPMTATLGARYKFLAPDGKEKGDIELNVGWENWSAERVTNYRVVVDGDVYVVNASGVETRTLRLYDSYLRHGLQDTFNVRLGGGYSLPAGDHEILLRGGISYDTAAAKEGWLRADIDGAARTTVAVGVGYKAKRWEVNVGGGAVFEGTNTNPGDCNPTGPAGMPATFGCGPGDAEQPVEDRRGPDPTSPVITTDNQAESPVNQGTFQSSYLMFMLGFSTWF